MGPSRRSNFWVFVLIALAGCSSAEKLKKERHRLARVHYFKGVEAIRHRDMPSALSELTTCLDQDPDFLRCRYEMGWAYFTDLKFRDTRDTWLQVKSVNPKFP